MAKVTTKDINMTGAEFQAFMDAGNDVLSDMDYGFNHESGEYDVPALEWDGWYGKHWCYFASEEARQARLERYNNDMVTFVLKYRIDKENKRKAKIAEAKRIKNLKTIGGQFPELRSLLVA
jgi:hypothetical protein